MKHDPSPASTVEAAAAMGVRLSAQEANRLLEFARLLGQRAASLGLISAGDVPRLHERHILDSLRAAALFRNDDTTAFDLGSGAGLPGIVLAIALPRCRFVLIEPRRVRVGFLELAVESLGLLNVQVAPLRSGDFFPERPADVITARAFAPLAPTWRAASRLLRPSGRLVYFAGESVADPLAEGKDAARTGPPADVAVERVLARSSPLVIMARR